MSGPVRSAGEPVPAEQARGGAHDRATSRGLRVLGVFAALGALQLLFLIGVELDRTVRHRAAIDELRQQVESLRAEADALHAVAEHADDDAYREQLARLQGFMYPDETRVVVLRDSSGP
ncbi:MAG: hypothetical protein U5K81_03505 [Trueperaceae bacterium]|nr:hypothetical protein [Trueperaceae bacterium]